MAAHFEAATLRVEIVEARGLRQAGRGNRSQLEIQRSYAQVYIEGLGPAYQRRTRHWRTKNNFNSDDPRWNQAFSVNIDGKQFAGEVYDGALRFLVLVARKNASVDEELVGTVRLPLGVLLQYLLSDESRSSHRSNTQRSGEPVFDRWYQMSLDFDNKNLLEGASGHAPTIHIKISLLGRGDTAGSKNGSVTSNKNSKVTKEQNRGDQRKQLRQLSLASSTKAAPNGGMERRKVPNRSPDDDVITPAVLGGNDFARSLVAVFERADSDRDGFVSVDDLRRVVARHPRLLAALNLPHPDTFTRVLEFLSGAAQSNDFSRNGNHKLDSPEHRGQRVPVTRATTNKNDNRQRRRLTIDDIHTVLVEQLRHPSVRKLITQAAESRIPSSNGADAKGVRTKALGFVFDVLVRQQRSAAPHPAVADDARLLATKSVLVLGHFAGEEWSHEELRGAMRQAGVRYTSLAAQAATSGGPTHGYLQHLTRSDFVAVCLVLLAGATKHTFDACVGGYLDFIEATTARRQLLTGVFETIVEPLSDDPHFSRIPPSGLAAQASHKDKRRASYSVSSPKPRQALPPAPPKKAALEQWCWCLNSGIATTRAAPRNAEISEEDRHLFLAGLATAQTMRTARAVFCGWSCRRVNTLSDAQLHSVVARYLDVHEAYAKRHQRKPDIALDHHSPSGAKGFAAQQQRQILAAAYRAVQGSPLSGEKDEDLTDKVGTTEIVHRRIARGISAPDLIEFGHYLGQAWNEVDCFRALNLSTIDVEDEDEAIPMISENAFLDFCICKLQAQDEMNGSKGSANGMQTASLLERIKRFLSVKGCSASRLRVLEDCLQVLQASGTTPPIAVSGRDMARPVAQTTAIFVSKEVWTFALIVRAGLSIAGLQKLQPLEEKGGDVLGPFVANGIRELLALSNDQQQASSPAVLRGLWLSIAAHLSENVTESELVKRLKNFATVISHQKTLPSSRRLALRLLNKDILFLAETIPQNGHSEITQVELPRYNFREDDTTSAARSSQLSPSREVYSRTEASFRLSHLNSIRGGVDGLVESYLATARAKARAKEKIGAVEASAASIAERNGSGAPDGNRRSPVKNNKAGMVGGESPSVQHLQVNELSSNRTVNGRRPWNEGYIRPHIESLVGPSTYGRRVGGTRKPSMVQHYACVALQAAARGVVSKNRFMRERKSARSIQMWWRRHFHGRCATVADEVRKLQLMSSEVVRGVRRLVQTSQLRISGDVVGASTIAALERAGLESANQLDVVAKQLMQLGGKPRQNNHGAYDDQGGVQMSATKGKKKAPRRQHHQQHKFAQEEPSPQLSTFQQRRQQLSKQNRKDDELTPRSTRSLQEVPPATIRPPTVSKLSSDRNQLAAVASTLSTSTRPRTTSTARSRVSFRALSGKGEALIFDETLTGSPSGASYPSGTDGEGEDGDEGETLWAESGGDKRLRSPPEECTQKIEKRSQIAAVEDTTTNDAAVLLAKAQERIAEVQKKNLELQSYKEKASMHLKAQHAVIQKLAKMGIGLRK